MTASATLFETRFSSATLSFVSATPRCLCARNEFKVIRTLFLGPMKHEQKNAREPRLYFMIHCCVLYHSPEPFYKTRSARVSGSERCRRRVYFFHEVTGEKEREGERSFSSASRLFLRPRFASADQMKIGSPLSENLPSILIGATVERSPRVSFTFRQDIIIKATNCN